MGTAHLFSYNLFSNGVITGCTQYGDMAVSLNTTDTPGFTVSNMGNPYHGPDEDLGYVIAKASSSGTRTHKRGSELAPDAVGFIRSTAKTDASFVDLVNKNFNQSFSLDSSGAISAKSYLTTNEYWASWTSTVISNLILNLDAGNTASYPGTGNIWYDLSGSNTNGSLTNGPAFSSANGGSIVFDGVDDFCDISTSQMTSNLITITGFIKWVAGTGRMFFGFSTYDVWTQNGTLGYNIGASDVYGISSATVTSLGLIGNWAHYTFVMTKTGSIITNNKLYINGNLQTLSQQLGTTGNSPGFSSNLRLCSWNSGGFYGNLQYGNLQVYNRALSQTEITQNFNAQKSRFGL
jgi:hypothetical protein